jgi:hypothetical protein
MSNSSNQHELLAVVQELNARDADLIAGLSDRFASCEGVGLRETIRSYHERLGVGLPDEGGRLDGEFRVEPDEARAFMEVLAWHPSLTEEHPLQVGLNLFGSDPIAGALFDLRREVSELLVAGALAIGYHETLDERFVYALVQAAVGADVLNTLFRRGLLGKPDLFRNPPLDDYKNLPGGLSDLRLGLADLTCMVGVQHALVQFAQLANSVNQQAVTTFRVWANGITKLVPDTGYGGTQVTIEGPGFGPHQPPGLTVNFPRAGGGCLIVPVIWSDTELVTVVPEGIGDGYVGFIQRDPPEPSASNADPSAGIELAGALENCIGTAAARVADRLTHWLPQIPFPSPGCPSALPNGANHFRGGPVITSLSPTNARQGDTIVVYGKLFAPTDVVLLDGQVCPTTAVSDTELKFVVPAVSGGKQDLKVRHSPNHVSNRMTLNVLPVILSSNVWRAKAGSSITLLGSGFANGARVRIQNFETPAQVISPNNLGFTFFRPPMLTGGSKFGDPVDAQVVLPDGTTSNKITLTFDVYRIVVFGDSIVSGQGLEEPQKFSTLVRDHIRNQLLGTTGVYIDVFAHSGATIGRKPVPDPTQLPALPGEVPTSYPTIYQQVDIWNTLPGSASEVEWGDLVLLNGGIGDCGPTTFLLPSTSTATIHTLTALHCHDAMMELLLYIAASFRKAKIIVTGYYPLVSHKSDTALLADLLIGMGVAIGQIYGAIVGGVLSIWAKNGIVTNCMTFATEANRQLQLAIDDVNTYMGGPARIFLAVPAFRPENAVLAPDPWVYGINSGSAGVTPQDPIAAARSADCAAAGSRTPWYCSLASLAHPNARGAQAYFDAIKPLL